MVEDATPKDKHLQIPIEPEGDDEDDDFGSILESETGDIGFETRQVSQHTSYTEEKRMLLHPSTKESEPTPRKDNDAATTGKVEREQTQSELSSFVQKKSFAQNMMDIALLSANTNQLRYVMDLGDKHPYYGTSLSLIILSLFMQVVVGLAMLYCNRYNIRNKGEMKRATHVNNLSVVGVFMVTLINVFISTFNGSQVQIVGDPTATSPTSPTINVSNDVGIDTW
ncbi:ninjurin a [Anopheles darlingi]|uniref:Ninjurin a n=2 Tax=Anopheles darlingi TaxID=43151 RepID=W5JMT4_ANODA|nr:ninjurin a [Anopheles darlingi]